jgi:hypothetical protein
MRKRNKSILDSWVSCQHEEDVPGTPLLRLQMTSPWPWSKPPGVRLGENRIRPPKSARSNADSGSSDNWQLLTVKPCFCSIIHSKRPRLIGQRRQISNRLPPMKLGFICRVPIHSEQSPTRKAIRWAACAYRSRCSRRQSPFICVIRNQPPFRNPCLLFMTNKTVSHYWWNYRDRPGHSSTPKRD